MQTNMIATVHDAEQYKKCCIIWKMQQQLSRTFLAQQTPELDTTT